MTNEKVKRMFDACYKAKRVRDMLPPLPGGVMPTYIQILDVIQKLEEKNGSVKISDVSDALQIPRPGVTRTVKDMERKGFLQKIASDDDGRVIYLTITDAGRNLSEKYDQKYFEMLSQALDSISDSEADCMIETIEKLYAVMCASLQIKSQAPNET